MMTFIDFFAGIGGFRLGLEQAGMKCVGFCEKDKYAVNSYRAMHDTKGEWYAEDVTEIKSEDVPRADLWCAGSPCQNVSICGGRDGLYGERSKLFFDFVRLIKGKSEEDRPEWIICENVKGLLSSNKGWDFLDYLFELESCGYDLEWQVFNSKDFGVPQSRARVYTVGHFRKRGRRKILPIERKNPAVVKQIIGGSQGYRVYDVGGVSVTLASNAGGLGAKTGLYLIDQSYTKSKITNIARCITTRYTSGIINHTSANSAVLMLNDNNIKIRRLTPKECFRLQGFPDDMFERARKVNSDNQLYKQAGNAVTVNVVRAIGEKIINGED